MISTVTSPTAVDKMLLFYQRYKNIYFSNWFKVNENTKLKFSDYYIPINILNADMS